MTVTTNAISLNKLAAQPAIAGCAWDYDALSYNVLSAGLLTLTAGNAAPTDLILNSAFKDVVINATAGTVKANCADFIVLSTGAAGMQSALGNLSLTAISGSINAVASADISLQPTGDLKASIASVTAAGAPPAISPPAGYSFVVREDATGKLKYLVP